MLSSLACYCYCNKGQVVIFPPHFHPIHEILYHSLTTNMLDSDVIQSVQHQIQRGKGATVNDPHRRSICKYSSSVPFYSLSILFMQMLFFL